MLHVDEPWDEITGTWREGTENGTNVYLAADARHGRKLC
jgi:hypothetical protein